jgi:predicted nucleic-acid-binding protein
VTKLWVDANVLVRLLTNDPVDMAESVSQLIARAEAGEFVLRVSPLVVAEVVWVLVSFYGYTREQVAETLIPFLRADGLELSEERQVVSALDSMGRCKVDFAGREATVPLRSPGWHRRTAPPRSGVRGGALLSLWRTTMNALLWLLQVHAGPVSARVSE